LSACWLLLLEDYGVTLEYLPEKKNVGTVADDLLCLDIDSLKIQEETEEVLILISGSDHILLCVCLLIMLIYFLLNYYLNLTLKSRILINLIGLSVCSE
jgi:hypothetical protein